MQKCSHSGVTLLCKFEISNQYLGCAEGGQTKALSLGINTPQPYGALPLSVMAGADHLYPHITHRA